MSQRFKQKLTSNFGGYSQDIDDDGEMSVTSSNDQKFSFWNEVNEYDVNILLQGSSRNLNFSEIKNELKNSDDAICLYRFASNYGGGICKGYLISGICLFHWHNLGISFTYLSARILDNVNSGSSRIVTNRLTPFFTNTHGKGNIIISPIAKSILRNDWVTKRNTLVSLLSACYTLAYSQDEATAMAKGLLTLIFGTDSEIITLRNVWVTKQKILARALDPNNVYQFIIQDNTDVNTEMIKIDDLSIYDTPLILTLNASTVILGDRTTNLANPANVSMFQIKEKNIGVFSIVGPIIYAPILKNQHKEKSDSSLMQQHVITYANIAGATLTTKHVIFPMTLSNNEVFLINIPKSKPFSNNYWSTMGNVNSQPMIFGHQQKNAKNDHIEEEEEKIVDNDIFSSSDPTDSLIHLNT